MKVIALGFFLVFMSLDQSQASPSSCKSFLNKKTSQNSEEQTEQSKFSLSFFTKIFGSKKSKNDDTSKRSGKVSPDAELVALKDVQVELSHILVSGINAVDLMDSAILKAVEALNYSAPETASYPTKKTALAATAAASESIVIYFEDLAVLEEAYVNLKTFKRSSKDTASFSLESYRELAFGLFSSNQEMDLNNLIRDLSDLRDQFLVINDRVEIELDSINAQLAYVL